MSRQQENAVLNTFSARLSGLMKKSGLTQEKLADATGISQPTISRYLRAVPSAQHVTAA